MTIQEWRTAPAWLGFIGLRALTRAAHHSGVLAPLAQPFRIHAATDVS